MNGREVLIGVSGGIAAFKAAIVVSQLVQEGAAVTVVMTANAREFIGPPTFAALTGRRVASDSFDTAYPLGAHIELAQRADLLCVTPATANFLAKASQGVADDLLSTLYLCFEGPILLAPAMNSQMWQAPAVQRNVERLQSDGVSIVDPEPGWLSCRQQGVGRMAAPESIVEAIRAALPAGRGASGTQPTSV